VGAQQKTRADKEEPEDFVVGQEIKGRRQLLINNAVSMLND
jgi:hypothetical protein